MKILEVTRHCVNVHSAIEFLRSRCILRRENPRCNTCERKMTEVKCGRAGGTYWRCPSHKNEKLSLRDGSFLQGQSLSLPKFIMVVYLWGYEIPVTKAAEMSDLCQKTTIDWYASLRDVCSDQLAITEENEDGGEEEGGSDVEDRIEKIDESSKAQKRKKQYEDEATWRHHYGKTPNEAFDNILLHISQLYVTP